MEIGTKTYISTVSFDKTSVRPFHLIQVFTLPDDLMCRLKKPEESFEYPLESIRALLDSWKNGRGVRQSTQVREPQTLQRFCQIGSAHILRRQGDSEDVRK